MTHVPGAHYVDGRWLDSGPRDIVSTNPADLDRVIGTFCDGVQIVDDAVAAAARHQRGWATAVLSERIEVVRAFGRALADDAEAIAAVITDEVGKPIAEARAEAAALSAKIDITCELAPRELARVEPDGVDGWYDWRPLGVMGVIGPFNFPVHLSNGHIIPALVAGNAVVLKPSETAPACAERYVRAWERAAADSGAPPGLLSLVQGAGAVGARLAAHDGVDGLAFTGSYDVGVAIRRATAHQTGKLLALEMGGKNATIVCAGADPVEAARIICAAALQTTGQRCTATSRVLVHASRADELMDALLAEVRRWPVGDPRDESMRMGPLATATACDRFDDAQAQLAGLETLHRGGRVHRRTRGHWVEPAIHRVTDIAAAAPRITTELFGPELLIETWTSLEQAAARHNATPYGLAAAVLGATDEEFAALRPSLRAGLVNRDRGTAGASSQLPFGGLGHSGNHRAAGALSLRYCAVPISTLTS